MLVTGALGLGWSLHPLRNSLRDTEEAVSSTGPCIREAGDIVLPESETRECFWLCLLLTVLPLPALTQPVPLGTCGRGTAPCPTRQPHASHCPAALLAAYLEDPWSPWGAQMKALTSAGFLATTRLCTDGYHGALGSSAGICPHCYGGGMTSGSSLPSHRPLGLSCDPWLWEMSPDVGLLALAPCPVLLWVGKGH